MHRLRPVERGGGVGELAGTVIEGALAAADAAEVEAQHGEAALGERVVEVVHDLVVHRATELGMRMQDDGDRRVALGGWVEPAFETAGGTVEDDFGHRDSWKAARSGRARSIREAVPLS